GGAKRTERKCGDPATHRKPSGSHELLSNVTSTATPLASAKFAGISQYSAQNGLRAAKRGQPIGARALSCFWVYLRQQRSRPPRDPSQLYSFLDRSSAKAVVGIATTAGKPTASASLPWSVSR